MSSSGRGDGAGWRRAGSLAALIALVGASLAAVVLLGRSAAPTDGAVPQGAPVVPSDAAAREIARPAGGSSDEEKRLLDEALRRLRQDKDLAGALRGAEDYLARFPRGALRPEAEVARAEALLGLGRRGEALDMLDQMNLTGLPRSRELRVLRGELLVEGRKLERALADFEAAQTGEGDEVEERAIFGQASCLAVQGDWAASRAALDRYLSRFPSGKYAEVARRGQGAR